MPDPDKQDSACPNHIAGPAKQACGMRIRTGYLKFYMQHPACQEARGVPIPLSRMQGEGTGPVLFAREKGFPAEGIEVLSPSDVMQALAE